MEQHYRQVVPGTHDISLDPLFLDVNTGDYHLPSGSPCRDAGTSSFGGLTLPADDLDGNGRSPGSFHDMGAHEYVDGRTCIPISGVTISGPTAGLVGMPYPFNSSVTPANASAPFRYVGSAGPGSGQGTASAIYTWGSRGPCTVQLTVSNCGVAGSASDDHGIVLSVGTVSRVFLPVVPRHSAP